MDHAETIDAVRRHYDQYADQEADRLTKDIKGRVSFEIHRRFLQRFVPEGSRVLEIGTGPGRFTTELANLGCEIIVTDLSPVQLDLNRQHLAGTPAERHILRRELLDVCDTSRYPDDEFDIVLAYGGPLSYAFDHAEQAMRGLVRITRPSGVILASVMSLLGTWRAFLPSITDLADHLGDDNAMDAAFRTGDLRHVQPDGHICRMFRYSDIRALNKNADARLIDASASNWASLVHHDTLTRLEADPDRWQRFLDQEAIACAQPGAYDGGTHLLFASSPTGRT